MKKRLHIFTKLLFAFVIAIHVLPSFTDHSFAQAEGPLDPAPEIVPSNPNGLNVLFDNTHGQTAGAADWVIDGAFSDFANAIANEGFHVKELRQTVPITYDHLKDYDVFVIPEANIPYKVSEQEAMIEYVEKGGSIFFISDHYNADRNKNRWDSSEVMNGYRRGAYDDPTKGMNVEEKSSEAMQEVDSSDWLADHFGIRFRYNAIGDVSAAMIASPEETFGITNGVNTVAMHAGSTLMITDPRKAKGLVYLPNGLTEDDKWNHAVDKGVYFGGGIEEGPYAAISKLGKGKAAFIGDSSPVEDATPKYVREENGEKKKTYDGFKEADDATLLINIITWLAEKEDYPNFEEANIPLDEPSPILDMEIPEKSTEPQPEPWAPPTPGYKWYDPSTFAPGSYGSTKDDEEESSYSIVHQEVLPNKELFQIRVVIDQLTPGETVSHLRVGIYLDGGEQVAKFQHEDATWPSTYGYSEPFSVTADATGRATKDLTVKIKEEVKGDAKIRIKEGSNNILTKEVSIDDVESVPLPDTENPEKITIAQARERAEGEIVTVEGVITSQPGVFGDKGFYIQDETAGIYVFQHEVGFQIGDIVKVTALTKKFHNELELESIQAIEKMGTKERPKAKTVSEINEAVQGQLVTLENVVIENITPYKQAFEFDLVGDEKTARVRVDERTGITFDSFVKKYAEGNRVNITGIASFFKDAFQLKLFMMDDIEPVIQKDREGPVIHDVAILSYFLTDTYKEKIVVTDEGSGVAETEVTLNGMTIENPIQIEPLQLAVGSHELRVRAVDHAGNDSERVFTLKVNMDIDHLDDLLVIGEKERLIKDVGISKSLSAKIVSIQAAKNKLVREKKLKALRNEVKALSGKKIDHRYAPHWFFAAS